MNVNISLLVNVDINICRRSFEIIYSFKIKSLNIFSSDIKNSLIRFLTFNTSSLEILKIKFLFLFNKIKIIEISILINIDLSNSGWRALQINVSDFLVRNLRNLNFLSSNWYTRGNNIFYVIILDVKPSVICY